MKKAAAMLARRAHSRGELRQKLSAVRADDGDAIQIEPILNRLEQLELLNDADYAYNFSFRHLKESGWGPEKIRAALCNREVSETDIDRALERVFSETGQPEKPGAAKMEKAEAPDLEATDSATMAHIERYCESYCRKKGMSATSSMSLKDAQKLARHLAGRGFDESLILDALRRVLPQEIFRYFEGAAK